jgi:hypothetical protein
MAKKERLKYDDIAENMPAPAEYSEPAPQDLSSLVEGMVREQSPINRSVEILSTVNPRTSEGSEIELKTDFGNRKQAIVHSIVDEMGRWLALTPDNFNDTPVILNLTEVLERKFLSIERKSRNEIVTIAKSPDTNILNQTNTGSGGGESFVKKMFSPRR